MSTLPAEEYPKPAEPLVIHFEDDRAVSRSDTRLKAHVQGSVIFIGDYWLLPTEARALRDWLNKVVP